jgi:hypothetical protein
MASDKAEDYAMLALTILRKIDWSGDLEKQKRQAAIWGYYWEDTQKEPTEKEIAELVEFLEGDDWSCYAQLRHEL